MISNDFHSIIKNYDLSYPNGFSHTSRSSSLIIGSFIYLMFQLVEIINQDHVHDSGFINYDLNQPSNPLFYSVTWKYFEKINCPNSICKNAFPYDIHQINDSFILINELVTYQNDDYYLTIHFVDINLPYL